MKDFREDIQAQVAAKIDGLEWVKLVGVGNVAAGKTCLIKYFCENKFSPGYQPTVGVDYGFKIETVEEQELRVHLWDISGNDEYYDTRVELYSKTDGVFIVFDVTSQPSFNAAGQWLEEITKAMPSPASPVIFLCGCKIDMNQKRSVTKASAEDWARQHKLTYFEVSSATGENVKEMYHSLLRKILAARSSSK